MIYLVVKNDTALLIQPKIKINNVRYKTQYMFCSLYRMSYTLPDQLLNIRFKIHYISIV